MGEDSCEEELQRKLEFDQASDRLEKGQYESSLLLLQNLGQHGYKDVAELVAVAEVWLAATRRSCLCTTLYQGKNLDWYLILKSIGPTKAHLPIYKIFSLSHQVEENDGINVIRRRYRQLALLLHPDKNKHPKAEGAFKLVSEAYRFLSDRDKRMLFDAHRSKNTCKICLKNSGDLNGSCASSVLGEVKPVQKLSEYFKSSIDKNDHHKKNKSDDEELQTFRERARARVDAMAWAWKERRTKLKEELKVKDVKLKCNSAEKMENPIFETYKYHSPSYIQKTVQSDKEGSIEIPSDNDFDDGSPQFAYARHISISRASKDFKQEKLEMTNYRKSTGSFTWSYNEKQIPSETTNNCAIIDLKRTLNKQPTCVRERSETSKNLKGLLQKLRSDSRNVPQYHGFKLWRRTAIHGIKNSSVDYKCPETP
ncbi:uncharacterized protein LOC131035841 isoform X1 [Cryptomeria japonica]|uniref:uncharacterized protein LOC131035841 isoform X1 n=1 Tax=Cryptomeria japonica TaxID=3369 RepID=UPI0027DA66D5|nr:uncharacterized protein LOC131035841 isoform X1 [Cryptomeria japonica]XP_057823568.2 uncharacterized protein LOC131035841 isoform X1 [Cryptomeria japonica]XP_057823570.2 uncharacterized protein LOC131035841 isoform X1 [Cryptomeria japonica]